MYLAQKHVNTPGIDCLIQRLSEYIYEYESNSFPTQSVTIKLRQHKSIPAQQISRQKKSGNVLARESNSRPSACMADALTIKPPAPVDIPQCN